MKHCVTSVVCVWALCTGGVWAGVEDPLTSAESVSEAPPCPANCSEGTTSAQPLHVGDATRSLLRQQAQGVHATTADHPMPGAVAQQVYQRYVKSFSHPIPEQLGSTLQPKK